MSTYAENDTRPNPFLHTLIIDGRELRGGSIYFRTIDEARTAAEILEAGFRSAPWLEEERYTVHIQRYPHSILPEYYLYVDPSDYYSAFVMGEHALRTAVRERIDAARRQTYGDSLASATTLLSGRLDAEGFPDGEREKVINDALNNTWSEGITLNEWVDAAERVVTGRVPA